MAVTYEVPGPAEVSSRARLVSRSGKYHLSVRMPSDDVQRPGAGLGYFAGEYPDGLTTVENVPSSAVVKVYWHSPGDPQDGLFVAQTVSAPDGTWRIGGLNHNLTYTIQAEKDGHRNAIAQGVRPLNLPRFSRQSITVTVGRPLDVELPIIGGEGEVVASLVSGSLPLGLTLDGTRIHGAWPTGTLGEYPLTFELVDDNETVQATLSLDLVVLPLMLMASTEIPDMLAVNKPMEPITFVASGGEGPYTFSYTGDLPDGTQFTDNGDGTATWDGEPDTEDSYSFTVTAEDARESTASRAVSIDVEIDDPHWDKVISLLHFDGDLSDEKGNTWTGSGIIVPDGRFGAGLNTSANQIQAPTATWNDLSSGQGDFTVEMFIKQTSPNAGAALISHIFMAPSGRFPFTIAFGKIDTATASNQMYFGYYNGTWIGADSTWEPVNDQWHHIAATRVGDVYRLFADGVLIASFTNSTAVAANGSVLYIGRRWDNFAPFYPLFRGVIDELRITKGVARYTTDFDPPTKPFPNF